MAVLQVDDDHVAICGLPQSVEDLHSTAVGNRLALDADVRGNGDADHSLLFALGKIDPHASVLNDATAFDDDIENGKNNWQQAKQQDSDEYNIVRLCTGPP